MVKMYAWELAYQKIIQNFRSTELKNLAKISIYNAFYWAVLITMTGIILLVIFSTYIALGNELTSSKAFTGLSLVMITLNVFIGRPAIAFGDLFVVSATMSRMGIALSLKARDSKGTTISATKGIVFEQLSASWQSKVVNQSNEQPDAKEEDSQPQTEIET